MGDLLLVARHLRDLSNEDMKNLGVALGLQSSSLQQMAEYNLKIQIVNAWLIGKDDVYTRSGPPSWTSLAKALESIGHTTIANAIKNSE